MGREWGSETVTRNSDECSNYSTITTLSIGVDSDSFLCGISGLFITVTTTRRHETHHSGVTERGTEERLGEWEPESQLVRPEVPSEDISPALKNIKAAG